MTRTSLSAADLPTHIGQTLGTSPWTLIDQDRIDRYAEATGDHQWIHTDPVRAAAGPYGTTIAHGLLTLGLLPLMTAEALEVTDAGMAVNYGLGRVRFPAPVPVGSRVRGQVKLLACQTLEGGATQITVEVKMEREGGAKPVCVAEALIRFLPGDRSV